MNFCHNLSGYQHHGGQESYAEEMTCKEGKSLYMHISVCVYIIMYQASDLDACVLHSILL